MSQLYSCVIRKDAKAVRDVPLTAIIATLLFSSSALLISVIWLMGCNRRFLSFVSDLSNSTSYAYQHESLIAEANGQSWKISGKNMYGIYAYISLGKSGRESRSIPEGEPVVLNYGNGSVLRLWDLPDDRGNARHNLFVHYTDAEGKVFSYINYRTSLETIMIRYLEYGSNEAL